MYNLQIANSNLYRNNTRVPFHKNELSIDMLGDLIDLLWPHQRSVIGPYSRYMNTALASMRIGRKFVSIEKYRACFDESLGLLRKYLPPSAKWRQNMSVHPVTTTFKSVMKNMQDVSNLYTILLNITVIKNLAYRQLSTNMKMHHWRIHLLQQMQELLLFHYTPRRANHSNEDFRQRSSMKNSLTRIYAQS